MKTILFFISVIGLFGCNAYTVKNDTEESIKAGEKTIKVGGCEEYSDSFFGLFGDYPISITKEDGSDLFENAEEEYEAAHYIVTEDAIDSTEEACEDEDEPAAPAEGETAAPAEGETAAPAEGETAAPAEGETAAPAEGETAAPAEGDAAPAEGETAAPAEGDAAPAEGDAAPAEGDAAPAEEE